MMCGPNQTSLGEVFVSDMQATLFMGIWLEYDLNGTLKVKYVRI